MMDSLGFLCVTFFFEGGREGGRESLRILERPARDKETRMRQMCCETDGRRDTSASRILCRSVCMLGFNKGGRGSVCVCVCVCVMAVADIVDFMFACAFLTC